MSTGSVNPPLKEKQLALANGCLEDDPFLLGGPNFRGELLVSGSATLSNCSLGLGYLSQNYISMT